MESILFFRGKNSIQQVYRIFKKLQDLDSRWKEVQFNAIRGYFSCYVIYDTARINPGDYNRIEIVAKSTNIPEIFFDDNYRVIKDKLLNGSQRVNILLIDDKADTVLKDYFVSYEWDQFNFILKLNLDDVKKMPDKELKNIDLILLDIDFSGTSSHKHETIRDGEGFEILKYLRSQKNSRYLPVVMFSDYNWDEDDAEIIDICWSNGSAGFYRKKDLGGKLRFLLNKISNTGGKDFIISINSEHINTEDTLVKILEFFDHKFAKVVQMAKTEKNRLIIRMSYFADENIGKLYQSFISESRLNKDDGKAVKFQKIDLYTRMHGI